ncbi:hypothetical protein HF086_016050 [Spodoptera exigua]|uniref:Uncharacterized protein n=1 Tax=Spodoptera exigua TaxID=7107 RepID=A0A922MPF1_SPOEX|nr:hypothetical protein HF086_016050 [Spodoptera exigua]
MQKMPSREDASCEEDSDMNFATFAPVGTAGTHLVTTSGQLPVQKLQQNVANNGAAMQQVNIGISDMTSRFISIPLVYSLICCNTLFYKFLLNIKLLYNKLCNSLKG